MLADRLKQLREENGLKQETLAGEIGCTRYMISYYENGRAPSYEILKAYCNRFGVSSDYLLELSNERRPASGKLSGLFDELAQMIGEAAPTASQLAALFDSVLLYYRHGAPCGNAPLLALGGFLDGLRAALDAASAGDGPALIDGANAAAVAALDVTKMPAVFYEKQKGDSLP